MKRFLIISLLFIFSAGIAFAETPSTRKRNLWHNKQDFEQGIDVGVGETQEWRIDRNGRLVWADGGYPYRSMQIPLNSFQISQDGVYDGVSSTTTPGLEDLNNQPAIVWSDAESSPVEVTFQVPQDFNFCVIIFFNGFNEKLGRAHIL